MTSTYDIAAKFVAAIAAFRTIDGPPDDDNLCNIQVVLLKVCLSVDLVGSTPRKVTGLILVNAVYKTTPGSGVVLFNEQEAALAKYDPSITKETETWEQKKKEAI